MKLKTKIIIFVLYILLAFVIVYLSYSYGKKYESNKNKLNELIKKEKIIEERYDEMIETNNRQREIIKDLIDKNKKSFDIISDIKKINDDATDRLNEIETSAYSINESLEKMRDNNKLLRNYYDSINARLNASED